MEKLVRVIKLRPGESVLIIAEEHPAPCPYGGFCTAPKHENEFSQSKGGDLCFMLQSLTQWGLP